MADVRRAYRRWFWRRMLWMLPGMLVAVVVTGRLAAEVDLELWLRLPALAISAGVALLFGGLSLVPLFVLRARSRGQIRRAQSLRREIRTYPALALIALSVSLLVLSVPLFIGPPSRKHEPAPTVAVGHRSHHPHGAPLPVAEAAGEGPPSGIDAPPSDPPPASTEPAPPPPPPPPAPAAPAPSGETSGAPADPVPAPLSPAFKAPELPAGEELLTLRFRPDAGEDLFGSPRFASLRALDRPGLPSEGDDEVWPTPELQLEMTVLPKSRGWSGAIYDASLDVPVSRNDSIRATFFLASLNDEQNSVEFEATVVWQRFTVEYERRLAGYTRTATFDLALRVGVAADRLDTHEATILVSSALRPSPLIGVEVALWQQEGLGLVAQASHSFAVRMNDAAMSATDVKIELRINLSERLSLQVGWHYVGTRVHDKGSAGGLAYQELEQSFSGPVGGLSLRF